MENKITALSDDELMEVTGGFVQLVNPSTCGSHKTKEQCHASKCKCSWSTESESCDGGCM